MTSTTRISSKIKFISILCAVLMVLNCAVTLVPIRVMASDGFTTYDLSDDVDIDGLSVTWGYTFTENFTKSGTEYDHVHEGYENASHVNQYDTFKGKNYYTFTDGAVHFYAESSQIRYYNADESKNTSYYPAVVSTLTLTNTTGFAMELGFNYSYSTGNTGTVSVDGVTLSAANASGQSFSKTLAAGESVEIVVNAASKSGSKGDVTVSDITAVANASQSVTFKTAAGGSYVVAANGTTYQITEDQMIAIDLSQPVTLTATADTGNRFAYWVSDGSVIFSSENGVILNKLPGSTVAPYFCDENSGYNFATGSGIECFTWEEAFSTAAYFEDYTVILLAGEHSLPTTLAGNLLSSDGEYVKSTGGKIKYIVPDGYTFLVPYAKRSNGTYDTTVTGRSNSTDHASSYTTAYSTLVLGTGTEVVVDGTMIVGAQQHTTGGGGKIMGEVGAKCGAVKLMGGDIDVFGVLHARGYIYDPTVHTAGNGNGKVTVEDDADVYVFLQLNDFRGGTASLQGSNNNELALNVYYFNNILATTVFKYGSELYGKAMLFAGDTFMEAETALVTDNNNIESLIVMQSDCVFITDYDVENDVFILDISEGHAKVKNLKVQLGSFSLDTEGKTLPINEGINIIINNDATVDVYCSLKCLPGFKMFVAEDATVNMHRSLYLYSASTYQQSWARDEMRRRQNCEFVLNGGQLIEPTEDAKVYLDGTVNIDEGLKIFESDDHSGSIVPGENACINLSSYMSYSANTDFLYEIPGTVSNQSQYTRVTNWEVFKAPIADLSESVTDTASFSRENNIEAGTYTTADLGDGYYWYKYTVAYNNGANTVATHYHAVQTTDVFDTSALSQAGERSVITAYSKTAEGSEEVTVSGGWTDSGTLYANAIADGWETISLANVNSNTTVDLTTRSYDHRVIWTVNSASPYAHYVTGESDEYRDTVVASVQSCVVTDEAGDPADVTAIPSYTASETALEISCIKSDIRASLVTSTEFVLVTWNLNYGGANQATYYSRVATGNTDCTFAIPQIANDAWYVAASSADVSVPAGITATADGLTLTLTGISDTGITADVDLTRYDQRVAFEAVGANETFPDRFINNGDTIELVAAGRYIFDEANCSASYLDGVEYVADANVSAVASNEQRTLTVSGTTHTDNLVTVALTPYDYAVSFRLDNSEVKVEYVDADGEASLTLPQNVAYVDLAIEGTAVDASVNATPDGRAVLHVTNVSSDVEISAGTLSFRSIVTFHETLGADITERYEYLPLGATTLAYTAEAGKVVTAVSGATVTGPANDTLNAADVSLGWENFTVTGLGNSNADVYVTLRAYDNRVTWIVREGDDAATVIHYVAGDSDEYNTASNYVIRSYQASYNGGAATTDTSSKTRFALSNIDGEPTVTLTVVRYVSVVTFEDASHNVLSGPIYVDEDGRSIFVAGGEVFYEPASSHVITAVEFAAGSATLNNARWRNSRFGNDALADFRDEIVLTGISAGTVTVTVTEREYDAIVNWTVKTFNGTEEYKKFITGSTDSYAVVDTASTDYEIEVLQSNKLTPSLSANEKTLELTGITSGAMISINVSDKNLGLFTGHSITLNGNIDLNFYLNLTDEQISDGTVITYTWRDGEKSEAFTVRSRDWVDGRGFKIPLNLPAAEMTYPVHAVVTIDGVVQTETDDFSVRDYALQILNMPGATDELVTLVKAMLDYGAKAQEAFGRTDTILANNGIDYTMSAADADDVAAAIAICPENGGKTASDMTEGTSAYGLNYYSSSLVFLSECTLRHYYSVSDGGVFGSYADGFNDSKAPYYYIEKTNIPAAELDELQDFVIGTTHYYFSALDFVKKVMEKYSPDSANYKLAEATYWYNQAANAYFH
ncbi:MAG: hypothetical protein IKN38_07725 [Clostridia bacterium]|nr:hypothetical protein [Clostridia bacterium]